jgi:hypothetical protein
MDEPDRQPGEPIASTSAHHPVCPEGSAEDVQSLTEASRQAHRQRRHLSAATGRNVMTAAPITKEHETTAEQIDRGHALTIDSGWREVAHTALAFVRRFA